MEIHYLKDIDSTHSYLQNLIQKDQYKGPLAIVAQNQTDGKGSRNNRWIGKEGDLFFSFVLEKSSLPEDLPIQSYSIYFSFLFREVLTSFGSKAWLKWPNDFYIDQKKIGGTITNIKGDLVFCGIGLNLIQREELYEALDICINKERVLESYFNAIVSKQSWKQVFSKFSIEFKKSKVCNTTIKNKKVSLQAASLQNDGSIIIDDKKVFSLR